MCFFRDDRYGRVEGGRYLAHLQIRYTTFVVALEVVRQEEARESVGDSPVHASTTFHPYLLVAVEVCNSMGSGLALGVTTATIIVVSRTDYCAVNHNVKLSIVSSKC